MGACCSCKTITRPKPFSSSTPANSKSIPLVYFLSHPYLFTYSPLHRTSWKEELSYDGQIDAHYRACMLNPKEMLVITLGQTLLVCVELSSAVRLKPIEASGIWKGNLHSYDGQAYAVNHAIVKYNSTTDIWETWVDYWSEIAEFYGSCLLSSDIYLIGSAPELQTQGLIRKVSLTDPAYVSISYFDNTAKLPLTVYSVGANKIALIGDSHQITYRTDMESFSAPTFQVDRSPAVLQFTSETCTCVLKETGYVLFISNGNTREVKIQDKEGESADIMSISTLLEQDRQRRNRPGLYTYAGNFIEEDYFVMRLDTLSLTTKMISASDEPLISKGAGVYLLENGELLLAGGFDKLGRVTAEVMVWNIGGQVRSATTALPHPQAFVVMTLEESSVYALGTESKEAQRNYFQRYDLDSTQWTELEVPASPVLSPGLTGFKGLVYSFGGCRQATVFTYTPSSNQWQTLSLTYPSPLSLILTIDLGDFVLCFSGIHLSNLTPSQETYTFNGTGFHQKQDSSFICDQSLPVRGYGRHTNLVCVVESSGVWSTYDWARDRWTREEELSISEDTNVV